MQTITSLLTFCFFVLSVSLNAQHMENNTLLNRYDFETQSIHVNDSVQIGYYETGEGATTLLMVHGLGGNMKHWEQNLAELSKKYRCIVIDLPGYWASATNKAWQSEDYIQFYADQLIAFTEKKKLEQPVLMGHSMGGQLSIVAALKAPHLFSRLILAAPAGIETFSKPHAELIKQMTAPQALMKQDEPALRHAFAVNFHQPPAGMEEMIQDRLWLKDSEYFEAYCQIVSNGVKGMLGHPVREKLNELQMPVLVVFGEEDQLIPNPYLHPALTIQALGEAAAEEIPDAKVVMLPKAGHLLQYDQPEAFNKAVISYIEETKNAEVKNASFE